MGPCLPTPPEPQSLDLDLLDRELRVAPAVTALLFRKVIASGACTRLSALRQMGKTITLDPILEVWRLDGRGDHPDWVRATQLERPPPCLRRWRVALLSVATAKSTHFPR